MACSKILISTSQGNGPLALCFHIRNTTSINTIFNFYSDGLEVVEFKKFIKFRNLSVLLREGG